MTKKDFPPSTFDGLHESIKYLSAAFVRLPTEFRVPLDRPQKAPIGFIDSLDKTVGRKSHCLQAGGEVFYRLMVVAVDGHFCRPEAFIQRRIRDDLNVVDGNVVRRALMVFRCGGKLQWDILI